MRTQSDRFVIAITFLLFVLGCKQEPKALLVVSFDKTVVAGNGLSPMNFSHPEFRGYLKKHSLLLQQGDVLTYQVPKLDLQKGTVQFRMKAGLHFPSSSTNAFYISDTKRTVQLSFDKNGIGIARENGSENSAAANPMIYGRWYLITVTWNGNSTQLYCDDQSLSLSKNDSVTTVKLPKSTASFSIGLWGNDSPFSILLRDLAVLNEDVDSDWLHRSVKSEQSATRLVYRMRDFVHWNGKEVSDAGADGGRAWTPDTELATFKNVQLPAAGNYELNFRVKPTVNIPAGMIRSEIRLHDQNGKLLGEFSKQNKTGELKGAGFSEKSTYQTFELNFHAPHSAFVDYGLFCFYPGKYSLFVDTVTLQQVNGKWIDKRRAEVLSHTMGIWREDSDAANGRAWTSQNSLNIGPYTCIGQPGRYRVTWRLKLEEGVQRNTPVVLLKVFAHDGFHGGNRRSNKDYAQLQIKSDDFASRNTWETKSIDFKYDGADLLEFIAHANILQPGSILFDTITVETLKK